jgi:hypothetical protein
LGEEQAAQAAPSSRHSKLAPASLEWNAKAAAVSLVEPDGPLSMVVSGAVVSTVNVRTGVARLFPAASDCCASTA